MTVIYTDGSILECSEIEIYGNEIVCDEYRIVPINEVEKIID